MALLPATVSASAPQLAAPAGLTLLELKMTGDEFVVLQNNTGDDIADLSSFWLTAYNNVSPVAANVSSSSQQLPATSLPAGQMLLLSANPMQTCGASVAGKLSLSLADGGGFLQLMRTSINQYGAITETPSDWVSWSSSAAGVIQNVPSNTKSPNTLYYRYSQSDSYAWQQAVIDVTNHCQLDLVVAGGTEPSSAVTPLTLAATSPPATILGNVDVSEGGSPLPVLPATDTGLQAPQLTELLPNPLGTGNDGTDEFIELYNPNSKPFDLTGFILQTGLTTTHQYTFPAGTTMVAKSFKAFYSAHTGLSLSNTSGRAALLDPFGTSIGASEAYTKAKDGQTWALAKGTWYWTLQATPSKANVIQQAAVKSSSSTKKSAKSSGASGAGTANASSAAGDENDDTGLPGAYVHVWVLALVAAIALLYGAYEYRRDVANRLFQLRAKFSASRTTGRSAEGRRSD